MRLLLFGSSARSGSRGWSDRIAVRKVLLKARPRILIRVATGREGAEVLIEEEGWLLGMPVLTIEMDSFVDGEVKNALPTAAIGLVVGQVGEVVGTRGRQLTDGSARMARTVRDAHIPLAVYRENGVEPCADIVRAERLLRQLGGAGLHRISVEEAADVLRRATARGPDEHRRAREAVRLLSRTATSITPWLDAIEAMFSAGE